MKDRRAGSVDRGTAIAVASAAALILLAAPASHATVVAEERIYTEWGIRSLAIGPGITAVRATAVGGKGGGSAGGFGAVVSAEVPVSEGLRLVVSVGRNGTSASGRLVPDSFAGGTGGDSSGIALCPSPAGRPRCLIERGITAAGGGGSGGGTLLLPGGAGGNADAPGSAGAAVPGGTAAGAGGAGTASAGGAGGAPAVLPPGGCKVSDPGVGGRPGELTGVGGLAVAQPEAYRTGGGGGAGNNGGGSGASAPVCDGELAGGAGGGGGGWSRVPNGGTIAVDTTGQPLVKVQLLREQVAPTIVIEAPGDGAASTRGEVVTVKYTCSDEANGSGIASCSGPIASGAPLPTDSTGRKTFTVTATDKAGNVASKTVGYTVADAVPTLRSVRVRAIWRRGVSGASVVIGFKLSRAAAVRLRIDRITNGTISGRRCVTPSRRGRTGRRCVRAVRVKSVRHAGRSGANSVTLRTARGGGLVPGRYRLTIEAVGAVGGKPVVVTRMFTVRRR
jgi:hypothetical protein